MTRYITQATHNPHMQAVRHHHYSHVRPAEKQRHPADKFEWGIRGYMVLLTIGSIAFGVFY